MLQLQALELHRLVGNRRSEGITLENLGTLAMDSGELDEALRLFDEGLAKLREVGDRLYEAILLDSLTLAHHRGGDAASASTHWREALSLCRKVVDRFSEAQILCDGAVIARQGFADFETAGLLLEQAECLALALDNPLKLAACLCQRGHLVLAQGLSAEVQLQEALLVAAKTDIGPSGALSKAIGRLQRAQQAYLEGLPLWRGEVPEDIPQGLRALLPN